MPTIFIDPGHGGKDPGAVGNGLYEKDVNLDICKKILKGLKAYDCTCILSRSTDEYITLDHRTETANKLKADVLVSVHINSALATARGFETFVYPGSKAATIAFQNVMHEEILKAMGSDIENRGKKQKDLHVLRESNMSAILTENLFISNKSDAKLLSDAAFLQKVANGHVKGLVRYLGLKKIATDAAPAKVWTVQAGSFENKENADMLCKQLLRDGYKAFVKEEQ